MVKIEVFSPNSSVAITMETLSYASNEIVKRLGGEALLQELRVSVLDESDRRVSLCFNRRNPQGVRSAVITRQPGGVYNVNCFGPLSLSSFEAPPRGYALRVHPENLATELARLTGIQNFPHHSL